MKIGAQLYTVKDFCKTPDDLSETLKKIADIGYKTVQLSQICEVSGEWIFNELKKNGLKCVCTHTNSKKLIENTDEVIKYHRAFDCKNIGLGYYKFDRADDTDYEEYYRIYKPIAEKIHESGMQFMHHNHNMEFKRLTTGELVIERMLNDFRAEEMNFILDTYWIQAGGADPAEYIKKFAGRIPCIHLKDYQYRPHLETSFKNYFAVIGEGSINFDRVFSAAESAGVEYMLVEQDDCYGENPFDCLKRSYKYLHSLGFE